MPVTRIRIPIQHHRRHRHPRHRHHRQRSPVVRVVGQVVQFGVQMAMRALWIRVIRGVGVITGVVRHPVSLGTRPLARASGRIVVRVIPTVPEAMARVQTALIPGISSKSVCFTLNPIHRHACGLLIAGALVLLSIVGVVCVFFVRPHETGP